MGKCKTIEDLFKGRHFEREISNAAVLKGESVAD